MSSTGDNFGQVIILLGPPGAGKGDLFVSYRRDEGGWGQPFSLGEGINTDQHEFCPMVTPDGKYLFFSRRWE